MNETIKVLLYFKTIKLDNGQKFQAPLVKYGERVFDATIKGTTLEEKLKPDMRLHKLEFPVELELVESNDDYFIKKETYTRKDGTKGTKNVICILDYSTIAQGKFPPKKTLEELVKDMEQETPF